MKLTDVLTIVLGIQILVTHIIALELYLYWLVWWLDIVVHFFGGVWLVFLWRITIDYGWVHKRQWSMTRVLLVTIGLMLVWEVFGLYLDGSFKDGYILDTATDLIFGIVGVSFGFWLLQRLQILNK